MDYGTWIKEFSAAVTICDPNGVILEMNDKAAQGFEKYGGRQLIGQSLFNCHSEPSQIKLAKMLKNQTPHSYTTEKNGVKKLVYQAPWHQDGRYAGFVEIVIEMPPNQPHYIRY